MHDDEHIPFMQRCLQLAMLGAGHVAPNPMVGAVLVYSNRIIGEGYHRQYGEAHAEVNCIAAVKDEDIDIIREATLYVSLEPCTHYGKTPPCSDLIIQKKIPRVIIGCSDPFEEVSARLTAPARAGTDGNDEVGQGKGIEKLKRAGIEVIAGVLETECKALNKGFFTFHIKHRPYIILKWAQTADNKIAYTSPKKLLISNEISNKIVHKWRSEESAILVGTNTAEKDDPKLTNRLWSGKNPIRLVLDMDLRLAKGLNIFNNGVPTIIFNLKQNTIEFTASLKNEVYYYQVTNDVSIVHQVANACYKLNIQSILVEGGAQLLQTFIDEDIWDEARIITNRNLFIGEGLGAPVIKNARLVHREHLNEDYIEYFGNNSNSL